MDRADAAIAQWARERPELPSLPMAMFGRPLEAAERVTRDHLNPLFAKAGLQSGEFDVLATLRRSGDPYMLSPTSLYEATDDLVGRHDQPTGSARARRADRAPSRPQRSPRQAHRLTAAGRRVIDENVDPARRQRGALMSVPHHRRAGEAQRAAQKLITGLAPSGAQDV